MGSSRHEPAAGGTSRSAARVGPGYIGCRHEPVISAAGTPASCHGPGWLIMTRITAGIPARFLQMILPVNHHACLGRGHNHYGGVGLNLNGPGPGPHRADVTRAQKGPATHHTSNSKGGGRPGTNGPSGPGISGSKEREREEREREERERERQTPSDRDS